MCWIACCYYASSVRLGGLGDWLWVWYTKSMFLVGIFQWWYGEGCLEHARRLYGGLLRTADQFSIGLLVRTLFNPYRQIAAGGVQGPLPVQLHAFFDRSFSRAVGFVVRTILIVVGLVVLLCRGLWSIASIVAWLLLPVLPLVGCLLWQWGVVLS